MLRYLPGFSACLFIVLLFFSCEKVIDVDLNTADPRIVIEGTITNQPGPHEIKLIRTINFDASNTFPPVSDAVVTLRDNAGNSEVLSETAPGIYTSSTIQGVPGRTYTLTVQSEGTIYTATSTMPPPADIDTLLTEQSAGPHGSGKIVRVQFTDVANTTNYYRFILLVNNDVVFTTIDDDRLQDGQKITFPLFSPDPPKGYLKTGDTATIYMQALDKGVYEYFRTLGQMRGGMHGGSLSTANPQTNIDNGALGYFSAHTVVTKTIQIR